MSVIAKVKEAIKSISGSSTESLNVSFSSDQKSQISQEMQDSLDATGLVPKNLRNSLEDEKTLEEYQQIEIENLRDVLNKEGTVKLDRNGKKVEGEKPKIRTPAKATAGPREYQFTEGEVLIIEPVEISFTNDAKSDNLDRKESSLSGQSTQFSKVTSDGMPSIVSDRMPSSDTVGKPTADSEQMSQMARDAISIKV